MAKFKAAIGTGFNDKDAQIIGKFIEKNFPDGVKPKELVDAARPTTSPIHEYFEWDDAKAGESYRLQQARQVISCLVVEYEERPVRAYFNVRLRDVGRTYLAVERVGADEELWDQVINDALKEVKIWESKYKTYKQLKPIFSSIRKVERKITA